MNGLSFRLLNLEYLKNWIIIATIRIFSKLNNTHLIRNTTTDAEVYFDPNRRKEFTSLLDRIGEDAKSLQRKAGKEDSETLDEYFTVLRETEERLEKINGGSRKVSTFKGKGQAIRKKPVFWKAVAPWPARKAKPNHWVSFAIVSEHWKMVTNKKGDYVELLNMLYYSSSFNCFVDFYSLETL